MQEIISSEYDAEMSQQAINDVLNIKVTMIELNTLHGVVRDEHQELRYNNLCGQLHSFLGRSN